MFDKKDIHKNDINIMSINHTKQFLAYLEKNNLLWYYISENYPQYLGPGGSVMIFAIANDFKLW